MGSTSNESKIMIKSKYDKNWIEKFYNLFREGSICSDSYLDISLIPTITLYLPFSEQEIPIYRKSNNRIGNISASHGKKFSPEVTAQ